MKPKHKLSFIVNLYEKMKQTNQTKNSLGNNLKTPAAILDIPQL